MKILVVEDEKLLADSIRILLEGKGLVAMKWHEKFVL